MRRGDLVDAQGRPIDLDAPYRPHSQLHYYRSLPPERPIPFEETIVYRDERILVADKPHYLPVTPKGRYLQLRVQMAALGLSIRNDRIYPQHQPETPPHQEPDYSRPLQLLAKTLEFVDPVTGEVKSFESSRQLGW